MDKQIPFDVLIIGAGIQGVGVAQACAAQGWTVAILEKSDAAAMGTSSKSSKLIHGGLRYLETGQIPLVYECLKERAILCRIAPNLVKLRDFLLPIYETSLRSPWRIALGLSVYWLLAGAKKNAQFCWRKRTACAGKRLNTKGLRAVFQYRDAQTDDKLLTEAVLRSATTLGAQCHFNQCVTSVDFVNGIFCVATKKGQTFRSNILVNAAGPWVNIVAACFTQKPPILPISLVKGSHLIIDSPEIKEYYYLESPEDSRPVFVLPWNGYVMLGTTEKIFTGNPDDVDCSEEEEKYLMNAFQYYFPGVKASSLDIVNRFSGLRVLPESRAGEGNKKLNRKNRDTTILKNNNYSGYYAIYGGKLTAYRSTAEKLTKMIKRDRKISGKYISTRDIILE